MDESVTKRAGGAVVYDALVDAGIEVLVGLPGTQTLPLDRVVAERTEMQYVMARHETAIPHIAWGYYETSGVPAATLTVPGPGETNAMHGLKNALEDCVPIIHVSADVPASARGKRPIHEIEPETYDTVVKENISITTPFDVEAAVKRGIETALTPPTGPVRLGIASDVLGANVPAIQAELTPGQEQRENEEAYTAAIELLTTASRPVIYAGGGVRRANGGAGGLRELVDRLDVPVVTSYKGKGTFPEDDPRWLGATGSHLPAGGKAVLDAADVVLAVGTDFDGVTTNSWSLPMGEQLVHVNLDPATFDRAYESDLAIVDDAGVALRTLVDGIDDTGACDSWDGARLGTAVREEYDRRLESIGSLDEGPTLRTPGVLGSVREVTPREAVVTTDIGGFRLWSIQAFEVYEQDDFVTAGSWAGMGVGLPAAIGAAVARDEPVVCLTGDGGLLMCIHELHTAAEYDLDITVVVSNNSDYGIISKSPEIRDYTGEHEFVWDSPSYVDIASGFGWAGERVETRTELEDAVERALARDGPTLIDAIVDTTEPSPVEAADFETNVDVRGT